jgi:hypothetical protein
MTPLPRFAKQEFFITEPGTRTVYGQTVKDWDAAGPPRPVYGWAEPAGTDEYNVNRDAVRTGWNVYLEPGTEPPTADAKIRLHDGQDYHAIGDPAPVPAAPTGPGRNRRTDHIFVYVERWKG